MNAEKFNAALGGLIDAVIQEGVGRNQTSFEEVLGVLDVHRHGVLHLRSKVLAELHARQSTKTILGANGEPAKGVGG